MTITPAPIDTDQLRRAWAQFPSGVAAIAAEVNGLRHVLIASAFSVGVSLDPPMVAFFVQRTSSTWPLLMEARALGVSVLGSGHGVTCRQLASTDRATRFDGVVTTQEDDGSIFIHGSTIWMHCSVSAVHPAGDHEIVLLGVNGVSHLEEIPPLVFHGSRFRNLA